MHKEIHEAADKAGRSFNAELLERLRSPPSEQLTRLYRAVTSQQELIKSLGSTLKAVAEAPAERTPFGHALAQKYAKAGGLFADGKMLEAFKVMDEAYKSLKEWSATEDGKSAIAVDRQRFPRDEPESKS